MTLSIFGILILLLGTLEQFMINHSRLMAFICILSLFGGCFYFKRTFPNTSALVRKLLSCMALLHLAGLFSDRWIIFTGLGVLLTFVGMIISMTGICKLWKNKVRHRFLLSFVSFLIFLPATGILFTTFFPNASMNLVRTVFYDDKNVTTAKSDQKTLGQLAELHSNLCYDTETPNGYLDIYYPFTPKETQPATLIYIHGGGYVWGDKQSGDPDAGELKLSDSLIYAALEQGYHVVSFNYCLAPEFPYPAAIEQLERGFHYLAEHAEELSLTMDRVFLAGSSAGGNLAGVLANLQTNEAYASQMGITPALSKSAIRGVIFESTLFDNSQYGITHEIPRDYLFYQLGRVYLQTNELKYDKNSVTHSNVTEFVTEDFPPSFISDGNTGSFYDQAQEMYTRLTNLGVDCQFVFYPKSEAVLKHGYEESGSSYALRTRNAMLEFMDSYD